MDSTSTNQLSPVLFKRTASWDGIRLEHFRFRAGELPEHRHAEHLITISLTGKCNGEIRTESGFRTGDEIKGSVCVIPSGQLYRAQVDGESEYLAIYVEPTLLLRAAADSRSPTSVAVIEKSAPSDSVISNVGMALLDEIETQSLGGRLYAESLANVLAIHLLRHYTTADLGGPRITGGLSGHRLQLVLEFIADNYGTDLSIADLAHVAGMSAFHFAREFKRSTGTTPHQYLIKFRIERAKALLAKSKLSLVEVGFRSGFSHQSHFTRLFHRITGTTPQSYRLIFQP